MLEDMFVDKLSNRKNCTLLFLITSNECRRCVLFFILLLVSVSFSVKVCYVKAIVLAAAFSSIVTHGAVFFLALNEDFLAALFLEM